LRAIAAGGPAFWSDDEELRLKQAECWPPDQLDAGYRYLLRKAASAR
jgi:L-fuculose-phosphate aldolase